MSLRPHHDASASQHRPAPQRSSLLRRCGSGAAAAVLVLGGLGIGTAATAGPAQAAPLGVDAAAAETVRPPDLEILESTAAPGDTITVAGEAWPADSTAVLTLYDNDGEAVLRTEELRPGSDGTFSIAEELPSDAAPGSLSVVVSSADHPEVAASAQVAVEPGAETSPEPFLDLDQTSILPGESITLTGEGWPAGHEVEVRLSGQQGEELRTDAATADAEGRISTTVLVPTSTAPELLTVTASQEAAGARSTMIPVLDTAALDSPYPSVTLTGSAAPEEDPAEQAVVLTGRSWSPGELVSVVLHDDAGQELARQEEIPAGEDGEFFSSMEIPQGLRAGTLTAVVTSEDEPAAVASDQLPWADSPQARAAAFLTVEEPLAEPGDSLTLSGTGWSAEAVTVTASGTREEQLLSTEPTVQEEGTFSADVVLPEETEPGLVRLTAAEEGFSSTVLVPVVRLPEAVSAEDPYADEPSAENTEEDEPGSGADGSGEDEEALVAEEGHEGTDAGTPGESPAPSSGAVLTEDPEGTSAAASEPEEQAAPLALTGPQITGLAVGALALLLLGAGALLAAREIRKLQDL